MQSMFFYTKAAVERAMKVQEVILRAMAKKITWWQAAEILGLSDRSMRRWRERYQEFGYDGLFDRRQGKPSPKRVPVAVVEQVLGLYRDRYFDLNVRHFHEKLAAEHGVELSYTWVKLALQGAGLVSRGRKRGVHRKRRPRRPLPGMLLHIDGSHHRWFQDERWDDLIVIMDDATSEIYYAQLVEEDESAHIIKAQCSTDNTDRNQKVAALAHLRMMWGSSCRINQPARRTSRRRLSKNMRQFFRHAGRNRCPKCQPNDEF
jgi:transposase